MSAIQVITSGSKLVVSTPFPNTNFNARAKTYGGRWVGERRAWEFDVRDEPIVRAALKRSYGGDGTVEPDTVSLQCHVEKDSWQSSVEVAGRIIATAWGRDSGAKLGPNVVKLAGSVTSGGSRANWTTVVDADVVIHDVPRKVAMKAIAGGYTGVSNAKLYDAAEAAAALDEDGVD